MNKTQAQQDDSINVLGETLRPCSHVPITGFYRDGCCNTGDEDKGKHTVCVEMTTKFLEFSKMRGNDLSTPRPEFGFPGLNPGDRWCLCADRWVEADAYDMAPYVILQSTHINSLETIPFAILRAKALDVN